MFKITSKEKLPKIDIQYCDKILDINQHLISEYSDNYTMLMAFKNLINEYPYNCCWNKFKKMTNPYELIHLSKKKKTDPNHSIARHIPFSRSYFKMWEIIHEYNLINDPNIINVSHIAEGPGGFMEAFINYRKKFNKKDNIFGITLKSSKKEIPGWNKSKYFIKRNKINISYGKDNTGDICNIENILSFKEYVGNNKCHLVTADGGFDFSIDFNHQEQQAFRLIFCEIVIALSVQKIGGTFIFKIFDIFTLLTANFIYLICNLYEDVSIYKPQTSRSANSEKYIIAKGFKGIDNDYLSKLYGIIRLWDSIEKNNYFITDLFEDIKDTQFIYIISKINGYHIKNQLKNIKATLELIKNRPSIKEYNRIIKKQVSNAVKWCKKYYVRTNENSKYLC